MSEDIKKPVTGMANAGGGTTNQDWWPNHLSLKSSTRIPPSPIRWMRNSITPKSSRPSI